MNMKRVSVFLAFLLVLLTFNAYACILPLQQSAGMDCPSETQEPVRGTCDAFIEIGPSSQVSVHPTLTAFSLDCAASVLLYQDLIVSPVLATESPQHCVDPSLHFSIRTTVLRV